MSDDIIKRLREAIAAGPTPGPWHHKEWGSEIVDDGVGSSQVLIAKVAINTYRDQGRHNATYIAAASPDNIAALLDRLDKAERECERLAGELKTANTQAEHFEREWYLRGDENERLRAALDIARDYVAANVAYLRQRYRGREQFGRVHEAEGDLAAIDAAMAADQPSGRREK